jgi:putative flippase GtrA
MSAIEPAMQDSPWRRQLPVFVMVGVFGYVVDSAVTYALARGAHLDPLIARLPAFAVATVLNFGLNRSLTFAGSRAPLLQAFLRYVLVCLGGLVINWCVYALAFEAARRIGAPTSPETLPLYVAAGSGAAMFATFFGFKLFAFRA